MNYGADWLQKWHDGQRVCAEGYFDRYFTYSVPIGDFPDTAINHLLKEIGEIAQEISSDNNPLKIVLTPENSGTVFIFI